MEQPKELFVKASLEVLEKYGDECLFRLTQEDNVDAFDEFCERLVATLRPLESESALFISPIVYKCCTAFVERALHDFTSSTVASTFNAKCKSSSS